MWYVDTFEFRQIRDIYFEMEGVYPRVLSWRKKKEIQEHIHGITSAIGTSW
jgi:hypothetical protein